MEDLFYRRSGKGQPVLLIHGFCETHEIWNKFADLLSENFEVLVVDLPGFGSSLLPTPPFSLGDVAKILLDWISKIGVNELSIIGHSLGGYVALEAARQGRAIVSGIALVNSTPYSDDEERKANRTKVIEFVRKNGVAPFVDTFVPGLFYSKMHPAIPVVDKIARKTPEETLLAYTQAMRDRPTSIDFLKSYDGKVLFVGGDKDRIIPMEKVCGFKNLAPKGGVTILEGSGHMAMYEAPDQLRIIITDFLRST